MSDESTAAATPAADDTITAAAPAAAQTAPSSAGEASASGEVASSVDVPTEGDASTPAPADDSPPAPAVTTPPDVDPEPARKHQLGDRVAYTTEWPQRTVQVGQVVDVRDDGAVAVAWFVGVSGPIDPDDPNLQAI